MPEHIFFLCAICDAVTMTAVSETCFMAHIHLRRTLHLLPAGLPFTIMTSTDHGLQSANFSLLHAVHQDGLQLHAGERHDVGKRHLGGRVHA